jgi:hypothetical protein
VSGRFSAMGMFRHLRCRITALYSLSEPLSMRFSLSLLLSCGLSTCATAQLQPCTPTGPWKEAPPKAVVEVSLTKRTIHVCDRTKPRECDWGTATFRIANCGSFPFYIPKTIRNVEWHGGFEDIVSGPFDAKGGLRSNEAADYSPDYHPDPRQSRPELTRWLGVGAHLASRMNYGVNWLPP